MFSCAQSSCSMQWISRLLSDPLSEVGAARPSHEALPRHCDMQPVKKSSGENKVAIILYEAVRRGRSRGSAAGRAAEWQCDPSRTRYCHRITPAATSAQGHVCVCVCVCVCSNVWTSKALDPVVEPAFPCDRPAAVAVLENGSQRHSELDPNSRSTADQDPSR